MATLTSRPVHLALGAPLRTAWGLLDRRTILHVRIAWSGDDAGDGEAAPLEPYDGVALATVQAALDAYALVLRDAGPDDDHEELLAACAAERDVPQALAAIDLALWDRAGRRAGQPVAHLLGAAPVQRVPVNASLGAEDRAGAARQAAAARANGYTCIKVKVGIGDDAGRIAAIRAAAGPNIALRIDANGAWRTVEEALANIEALAPSGIELAEEPVHGVEALRALRGRSPVPIAMDETADHEPGASAAGAVDAVCLKISRCGGISGLLAEAEEARAAGAEVYVASTYDGPHGIAAGLHAAAALAATGPLLPCGLATLAMYPALAPAMAPRSGVIAVPSGPGLLGRRLPPG
jgi:L-alanine-DL-glutamate epimerase-like enolase superfamily enzyme